MDYSKFILLSDIPTKTQYSNKKNKKKELSRRLNKMRITIHTCNRGFRWVLKNDLHKIKKYLKDGYYEEKVRNNNLKFIMKYASTFDGVPIKNIANDLGFKSASSIWARVNRLGWNILDAISIEKGGKPQGFRDKKSYTIKRKDTLKRRR